MQPPNIKRLKSEDFPEEQRELVDRIAGSLNDFVEQTIFLLTKRVDFKNLNQTIASVNITSGSTNTTDGSIRSPVTIKTDINGRIVGTVLINLVNKTNPIALPTNQPFVSYTINQNLITIQKVYGLNNTSEYTLTLLIIGDNV
jgi:hypothetical protein